MNIKSVFKIISYTLIIAVCIGLFGCGKEIFTPSDTLNSGIIVSQLIDENSDILNESGISDNIEDEIKNNTGRIVFSSPQFETFIIHDETMNFSGLCNNNYPLLLDGEEQSVGEDGYFTITRILELGRNEITFKNGDFTRTFNITYTRPLIKSYTPYDASLTLDGGIPLSVTAVAKSGATVTAKYNGKTYTLAPSSVEDEFYETYKCIITTAKSGNHTIKITASLGDEKQTVTATKIIIKSQAASYNHTPVKSLKNTGYADVGNKYVAEIVATTSEGFLGGTVDDYSRPTVNYLPKGTVDYCSPSKIYDSESGKKYYLLRNNVRVYAKKKNVKVYEGSLPKTNTVTYAGGEVRDKHLLLNFAVDWKAPFRFVLDKQGYKNEKAQDYSISSPAFSYVDITFCYSDAVENFSLPENPVFKSYKIIKNQKDYTLRLYLKTAGKFWGWKASYITSGHLQFSFLCPSKLQKANNQYGYSLEGIKITVDAGHGGSDSGTYNAANSPYYESFYNLNYAKMLVNKLLKLGATVYMTRTEDKTMSLESRYNYITATNCDLAISVHFNGSTNGDVNGYFMGYFNPYTYNAARHISRSIASTGLMSPEDSGLDWHYFNLSRVSNCPVVLTENGYLTGISDYRKIKTGAFCDAYMEGMVQGIINYFAEESGYFVDSNYVPQNVLDVASKLQTQSNPSANTYPPSATASNNVPVISSKVSGIMSTLPSTKPPISSSTTANTNSAASATLSFIPNTQNSSNILSRPIQNTPSYISRVPDSASKVSSIMGTDTSSETQANTSSIVSNRPPVSSVPSRVVSSVSASSNSLIESSAVSSVSVSADSDADAESSPTSEGTAPEGETSNTSASPSDTTTETFH